MNIVVEYYSLLCSHERAPADFLPNLSNSNDSSRKLWGIVKNIASVGPPADIVDIVDITDKERVANWSAVENGRDQPTGLEGHAAANAAFDDMERVSASPDDHDRIIGSSESERSDNFTRIRNEARAHTYTWREKGTRQAFAARKIYG